MKKVFQHTRVRDIAENLEDALVVSPAEKTEIKGRGEYAVVRIDSGEAAIKLCTKKSEE